MFIGVVREIDFRETLIVLQASIENVLQNEYDDETKLKILQKYIDDLKVAKRQIKNNFWSNT